MEDVHAEMARQEQWTCPKDRVMKEEVTKQERTTSPLDRFTRQDLQGNTESEIIEVLHNKAMVCGMD
eukprot:4312787-Prorocentrum_lima.AAC.1